MDWPNHFIHANIIMSQGRTTCRFNLGASELRKGGSAMKEKLSHALKELGKVAKVLAIVSDAGLKVLALFKG